MWLHPVIHQPFVLTECVVCVIKLSRLFEKSMDESKKALKHHGKHVDHKSSLKKIPETEKENTVITA